MDDPFKKFTAADQTEYKEHVVFKDLEKFIKFYDSFSMSIMGFVTLGTRAIMNIDTYVYSSIQGTLESIKLILEQGRIGDAYALLRKYHDSVTLNLYTNLYLEENHDLQKNLIVQEVVDWLSSRKRLPHDNYKAMSQYLEMSPRLKEMFKVLYSDESYIQTRNRCNDHMHYNYFDNVLINDNQAHFPKRLSLLDSFREDLESIFILHLSCIFYLNGHYMISSDYTDALDVGIPPEPSSESWVAPFVQEVFTNVIEANRPDVAALIKSSTSMQLA